MVFHIKDFMLTLENYSLLEVKDFISKLRWKVVALPSRSVCFIICLFVWLEGGGFTEQRCLFDWNSNHFPFSFDELPLNSGGRNFSSDPPADTSRPCIIILLTHFSSNFPFIFLYPALSPLVLWTRIKQIFLEELITVTIWRQGSTMKESFVKFYRYGLHTLKYTWTIHSERQYFIEDKKKIWLVEYQAAVNGKFLFWSYYWTKKLEEEYQFFHYFKKEEKKEKKREFASKWLYRAEIRIF